MPHSAPSSKIPMFVLACFCLVVFPAAMAATSCSDAHVGCFPKLETSSWVRKPGLVTTVVDNQANRVFVVFPAGTDRVLGRFIYQTYLRAGLGSTPVGLDRSQSGPSQIVAFERHGSQIVVRIENTSFTAHDIAQQQSVRESFADSVVYQAPISEVAQDGSVLIELQKWLTRDAFGVIDRLREAHQGDFKIDDRLNLIDPDSVQAFSDNLEFDVSQTFVSDHPGSEVNGIVPDQHAVTLILDHSLIRLPEPGYEPLLADPRTGAISSAIADYSQPLGKPLVLNLAHRFRLQKTDPTASRSTVVKPIVFYVDRQAPPEIQRDLIEGASWWSEAFDKAGFIDAFKVELLPEGASVLDARYNVINWVHRQTRGWSYGENVIDPRTGEIVRGAVLLGSLRARQDRMIFEGLVGAEHTGTGDSKDPLMAVDKRLKQLAAHETGHAIGLEHNFIASTYDDRASVMDYPPPRVLINNHELDLSDVYKNGLGSWDLFAIHWLYGQPENHSNAEATRDQWVRTAYQSGQRFVADGDARPVSSGLANGALWDDGSNPIDGLEHALAVRRIALDHFGAHNLRAGAPLYELRRLVVPIYLFHRYEVEAASKWIGGSWVNYSVNGDGLPPSRVVNGLDQHRALQTILSSLSPETLDITPELVELLSAGEGDISNIESKVELFHSDTQPQFNLESAASATADLTLKALWSPARLNRVAIQDDKILSTRELLMEPVHYLLSNHSTTAHSKMITETVVSREILHLATLLNDRELSPRVTAEVHSVLEQLPSELNKSHAVSDAFKRYWTQSLRQDRPTIDLKLAEHNERVPPGMPIGSASSLDSGLWDFEN